MIKTPKTKRETRRAALLILLTCLFAHALARDVRARQPSPPEPATAGNPIQIIPAPKSVERAGEDFRLARGARVVLADSKSGADRFAAQDFADDVKATAGVALKVGTGGGKRQILVGPLSNA